ncbi:transglycosylase domain-containing protein [Capillimicrobium parvum]|uniref:Biosynthetic peptidoglycan transglycosylase n=1 Tax=Capillimicrobium parvum TaxID=2884022 RepID=A0A9E6XZQ7_9ACTN|nr:transglycosylase domain-containing protein [Capillimicrobium parvum]UGS37369.1 Biosynthetic peptidoglycan transglycosylase [Capillimicrobium parvum]
MLAVVVTIVTAVGAAAAVAASWVIGVIDDTPDIAHLKPKPQGAISTVYAADGTRLGFISSDTLRSRVGAGRIPDVVRKATVAIEDRRFYEHGGVDYVGIGRAALKNISKGRSLQGGSTLTMQLVRNLYTPSTRNQKTLTRKIREAKLADELEQEHTKGWILDSYLNNVPYGTVGGQTAVGIEAAARIFFDTPASRLTLPQAALLAGLPQAPSEYNPFQDQRAAKKRRGEVLDAMVKSRYITPAQAARAKARKLGVHHNTYYQQRREQFFFDYVKQELIKRYGVATVRRGGLRVYTTVDLHLQELARQAIADHLNQPGQPSAALVTVDPRNGHILAMASSATYGPTVFNYATQAFRQPGSTFKGIDLMAAVRLGIDPDTTYYDSHELMPGWDPVEPTWHVQTDDHSYRGSVSLTNAIIASDNTVYAQLGADITPERVRKAAYDMGITSHLNAYPAEAIGGLRRGVSPLEMADAYATIADGGWRNRVTAIAKVVHPDGTVDHPGVGRRRKEFTDGQTAKVIGALKGVLVSGTAAGQGIGCPAAGKTGTTSSFTDAWFVGFTPRLSTAVWVGYPKETTSMTAVPGYGEVFGGTLPAPIWHEYMAAAKGSYCGEFPKPKHPFVASDFHGSFESGHRGGQSGTGTGTDGTGTGTGTGTTTPPGTTTTAPGATTTAPGATTTAPATTGAGGTGSGTGSGTGATGSPDGYSTAGGGTGGGDAGTGGPTGGAAPPG